MIEDKTITLDGEVENGFDDSAALPGRLNRYAVAHRRAVKMSHFIKSVPAVNTPRSQADLNYLAANLHNCGSYLVFRDYYTVGKVRLSAANFCRKHLLCPLCAIRRGAKALKAYTDRLSILLQDNSNLKPYLVTFTIKNRDDLGDAFSHFTRSMKRYTDKRRKALSASNRNIPVEMNKAAGGVSSIEVKRGEGSGLWHVHSHSVWLCEQMPDARILAEEWQAVTGDSYIVDVRPFSGSSIADYLTGFMEVFKYAVKFSSLELSDNWEAFNLLSGRRLVNSFGLFRGVEVPEEMTDEPLDDLPYIEMFYQYIDGAGYTYVHKPEPLASAVDSDFAAGEIPY
jgi:hypothetical protein